MAATTLLGSPVPLTRRYDVALLDLDGVVYVGPDAVPGVPAALEQARGEGMRLAFVTNNAARPPGAVAEHLTDLGVTAVPAEVTTSSQAAAHYLADRLPSESAVLVVGTTGLVEALTERGLRPVFTAEPDVAAVVQGYSPTLDWAQLAEGAVAIRRGVPWVATNLDPTVPSPRGPLPGNGSLVAALRHATGREPVATGKPDPTMHLESVQRSGAEHPIVVGDRLDTDVEGANAVGCASLLVLSGVTTATDLLTAGELLRPTFLGHDASALLATHPSVTVTADGQASCGRWSAQWDGDDVELSCAPETAASSDASADATSTGTDDANGDADGLDGLRALCSSVWSRGSAARPSAPVCRGADAAAADALRAWGLVSAG